MKRKHDTDSALCWCRPRLEKRCPTCSGNGTEWGSDACWRCKGEGWIEAGPYDSDPLVIHNDIDEEAEYSQPGSGWRTALLWGAISLIVVAMLWLVLNGGGRR